MITAVSKVVVPVDNQERAKHFWVDRLGFELRRDERMGMSAGSRSARPGKASSWH